MRPKINILYADDDAIAVELLKRQVGTDDFCVRIASDGQKAWELFQSHVPDILLLDIKMPYLDGLDIIKLVRKINQKTPIVVYSSHLNTTRELEAFNLGADDCICKEIEPDLLIAKLKRIYDRVTKGETDPQIYILSDHSKFNSVAGILTINDKIVRLKPYDSRLLYLLCVKFGELADEDYLIEGLWGMADSNKGGSLRRCINHFRKILADDIEIMIKNQYSRGYTLATLKLDSLL